MLTGTAAVRDSRSARDKNDEEAQDLERDVLSDNSRSHHRTLVLVSSIAVVVALLDLVPREISAIGVRLDSDDRRAALWVLVVVLAYFGVAFVIHAAPDITRAWRNTKLGAEMVQRTKTNVARAHQHATTRGDRADPARAAEAELAHADYRQLRWTHWARMIFELWLPLAWFGIALLVLGIELA